MLRPSTSAAPSAAGTIAVTLRNGGAGEELRLTIGDDGQGLDDGSGHDGLGMRLVNGLMQQVGGSIERKTDAGARFEIVVPKSEPRPGAGNGDAAKAAASFRSADRG